MTGIRDQLKPRKKPTVMELASEAGLDVTAWANYAGGVARAASNPKFCYEWGFLEEGKLAVLNLWLASFDEQNGLVTAMLDPEPRARTLDHVSGRGSVAARARRLEAILHHVWEVGLQVRVIVIDGQRRGIEFTSDRASKVRGRLLDPVAWAVTEHDIQGDRWFLTRGATPVTAVDQFETAQEPEEAAARHITSSLVFDRNAQVRLSVRVRSKGCCEWCGAEGFLTPAGRRYVETHHIVPLSEDGPDAIQNVIALCPNHHREAHLGLSAATLRSVMLAKVRSILEGRGSN